MIMWSKYFRKGVLKIIFKALFCNFSNLFKCALQVDAHIGNAQSSYDSTTIITA